jgi:hypothetical protein
VLILLSTETDEIYWNGKYEPVQDDNGRNCMKYSALLWQLHNMVMQKNSCSFWFFICTCIIYLFKLQNFMPFSLNLHWLVVILNATKCEIQMLNSTTFPSVSNENHHMITEIKTLVCLKTLI